MRKPLQIKIGNPNIEIRNRLVWKFLILDELKLFRISPACLAAGRSFEFVVLFMRGVLCAFVHFKD